MFGFIDINKKIEDADLKADNAWARMSFSSDRALNLAVSLFSRCLDEDDLQENGIADLTRDLNEIVSSTSAARSFSPEVEVFIRPLKLHLTKAFNEKLGRTKFKQIEEFALSNTEQKVVLGAKDFVEKLLAGSSQSDNRVLASKLTIGVMRLGKVYASHGTKVFASQHIPAAQKILDILENNPESLRQHIGKKIGTVGGLLEDGGEDQKSVAKVAKNFRFGLFR